MSEVFNAQSAAPFECASVLLVGFNRPRLNRHPPLLREVKNFHIIAP